MRSLKPESGLDLIPRDVVVLSASSVKLTPVINLISGINKHIERVSVQDHRNPAATTRNRDRLSGPTRLLDDLGQPIPSVTYCHLIHVRIVQHPPTEGNNVLRI